MTYSVFLALISDTSTVAVFVALGLFLTLMVALSLFVRRTMHHRPIWQQSLSHPPHPGYYSAREKRRVYREVAE
jgi:hypothetical protein